MPPSGLPPSSPGPRGLNPGPATPERRRHELTAPFAMGVALLLLGAAYLVLHFAPVPGLPRLAGPGLVVAMLLLGSGQLAILLRVSAAATARPASAAAPATAGREAGEAQDQIRALMASGQSGEIDTLMREFTRIMEILQEQASQVQDYAGRFEAINEELRNANLRLRELSLTDELTEVGNRRNFDVRMREEINRSTRFGHAFSLLMLDIDAFKKFNDEFGHPQGDAVLRGLGALMRSLSREGDVPCRVGGEEFAFILPETGKGDARAFAERMRRGVEASIKAPDGKRPITISIGLAAFPEDGKTPEDLVRAADEALYESKHAGRNRVTAYLRK
jgi:diguanylate cyclase (GGDEF)-like protein